MTSLNSLGSDTTTERSRRRQEMRRFQMRSGTRRVGGGGPVVELYKASDAQDTWCRSGATPWAATATTTGETVASLRFAARAGGCANPAPQSPNPETVSSAVVDRWQVSVEGAAGSCDAHDSRHGRFKPGPVAKTDRTMIVRTRCTDNSRQEPYPV
jgi:hypothetical protein